MNNEGKHTVSLLSWFQNFLQAIASPETVAYAQEVTQKAVLNQVKPIINNVRSKNQWQER